MDLGFKSSNFRVILFFVTLNTCLEIKIGFPKQVVGSFTKWLFAPEKFLGLLRNKGRRGGGKGRTAKVPW